jgi:putative flippase GtrA
MLVRFAGYAIVGGIGAALHYAVMVACVELLRVPVLAASALGFVAALVAQFALNRRWVFGSRAGVAGSFARYAITSVWGLLLNLAVLYATTSLFGWHYLIGAIVAIGVVTPMNFVLNQRWTFRAGGRG